MGRSFVRVILGILLVLILLAGAGGAFVWWKISALKQVLVGDLGKAIGASVQVTSLDLDVWKGELNATGISLVNQRPSAPWDKGDISQVSLHFHLSDIFSPAMPVTVEVSSWNAAHGCRHFPGRRTLLRSHSGHSYLRATRHRGN